MGNAEERYQVGRRRRRVVVPEWRQHELRRRLMALYQGDTHYERIIVGQLRPQWENLKRATALYPYADDNVLPPYHIHRYTRLVEAHHRLTQHPGSQQQAGDAQTLANLAAYLTALRAVVKEQLRLTKDGEPVEWAVDVLHDDVREQHEVEREPDYHAKTQHAALHILLSPRHADLLATVGGITAIEYAVAPVEGDAERHPEIITSVLRTLVPLEQRPEGRTIGPGPSRQHPLPVTVPLDGCRVARDTVRGEDASFDAWELLEERAVLLLREAIAELRLGYRALYDQAANPTRLDEEEHDLHKLQRFLLHERESVPLLPYERRRVLPLAKDLGIDLPSPSFRKRRVRD